MGVAFCIPWDDDDDKTEQVPAKVYEPDKMLGWGAGAFTFLALFFTLVFLCAGYWFQQGVDRWPHYAFSFSLGALALGAAAVAFFLFMWRAAVAQTAHRRQREMFWEGCRRAENLKEKQLHALIERTWDVFLGSFELRPIPMAEGKTCLALIQIVEGRENVSFVLRRRESAPEWVRRIWPEEMRLRVPRHAFKVHGSADESRGMIVGRVTSSATLPPTQVHSFTDLIEVMVSGKPEELSRMLVREDTWFRLSGSQLRTPYHPEFPVDQAEVPEPPQPDSPPPSPDAASTPPDSTLPPAEGASPTPPETTSAQASGGPTHTHDSI